MTAIFLSLTCNKKGEQYEAILKTSSFFQFDAAISPAISCYLKLAMIIFFSFFVLLNAEKTPLPQFPRMKERLSSLNLLFEAQESVTNKEKKNMSFGLREKLQFQWLNNEADSFRKTQNKTKQKP